MKTSLLPGTLLACLIPALIASSPLVHAEEAVTTHPDSQGVMNIPPRQWGIPPRNTDWSIPPISQRWGNPQRSGHWTIPPISKRWGIPPRSSRWTIPRSASDMAAPRENSVSTGLDGRTPVR